MATVKSSPKRARNCSWVVINIPYGPLYCQGSSWPRPMDSFFERGLNTPGTVVRVDGTDYLIGDIAPGGGCGDDWSDINPSSIVEAYRVVYQT